MRYGLKLQQNMTSIFLNTGNILIQVIVKIAHTAKDQMLPKYNPF